MAINEQHKSYCPFNEFLNYGLKNKVSPLWKKTRDILGDRVGYILYPSKSTANYQCSNIVDALEGSTGTLGLEIALTLKLLIPKCKYGRFGRNIICIDVINPYQIPVVNLENLGGKWLLSEDYNQKGIFLFEDERYLIVVQDVEKEIQIHLYKK